MGAGSIDDAGRGRKGEAVRATAAPLHLSGNRDSVSKPGPWLAEVYVIEFRCEEALLDVMEVVTLSASSPVDLE